MRNEICENLNRTEQLENCSFAKTILMIIIVFYHSILFWKGNWFDTIEPVYSCKSLGVLAEWLNTFHIYAFTLISGYIFYYIKFEKHGYQIALSFIKNKFKRLIIPYAFVSVIWVIPISIYFFHYDVSEILKKYILGVSPSQLWFLLMLFHVFWICNFLSDFFMKRNGVSIMILLLMYGVGIVGGHIFPNVFQIFTSLRYCIFFFIGFKFRQYDLLRYCNRKIIVVGFITNVLLFLLYEYLSDFDSSLITIFNLGINFLTNIVGAVWIFALLQNIANKIHFKENLLFIFLSKRSMCIYLFHQQIIYFCLFYLNGLVNPYINSILNFFIALIVSSVLSTILMKFKITKFLIGEK